MASGRLWPARQAWDGAHEDLYAAWVEALFDYPVDEDLTWTSLHTLLAWYGEGKLHPHIGHTLQLPCADAALDLLRTRKSVGKVVVTM